METTKQNGNGTGLARVEPQSQALGISGGVRIDSMRDVFKLAEQLAEARGFVPDHYIGKPTAIAAAMLTGIELGLGPMLSLRAVYIVKGKPSLSAQLMVMLAQRAGVKVRWLKSDATIATIGVTLPGAAEQSMSFTKEDAERAGLWGQQGPWKQYPANMLRARCASNAIAAFCPYVLGGGVYEAESGETTGGIPAGDVIEATYVETKPEAPKTSKRKLSDCASAPEVLAWIDENAALVRDGGAKALARTVEHAVKYGVSEHVVRQRAGLDQAAPPPRENDDGSLNEDPPPS